MRFLSASALFLMLVLYPYQASADTKTEIKAELEYLEQAWAEGNLVAVRGHYHYSFTYVSESGELNLNQRVKDIELVMEDGGDSGNLEFSDIHVRPLGDDHALVWGRCKLRFEDGTELDSLFSSVYMKTPSGWKLVFNHD